MKDMRVAIQRCSRIGVIVLLLSFAFSGCATHKGVADEELATRQKFDYFYLEAERLKAIGQDDAAFDMMRRAIEVDTASAAARFFIAPYYLSLGKYEQAQKDFRYAADCNPENYWYNVVYGNFSQRLGDYDEAVRIWSRLLEQNPDKPELNSALADAYVAQDEIEEAIACYSRMEEAMGFSEGITLEKMRLYKAIGEDSLVIAEAEKLQQAHPQNGNYMRLLGNVYLATNRDSMALATYNKALSIDPDDGYTYLSKAEYYKKHNDSIAYNNEIGNALLHRHIDVDTKVNILRAYIVELMEQQKELSRVDSFFVKIIEQHPQAEQVRSLYGLYFSSRGEYNRAGEQYVIAADLEPTHADNWLQLIELYFYQERYNEVVEAGNRAIQYVPEETAFYLYASLACLQQKKYDEAIAWLKQGLSFVDKEDSRTLSNFYGQLGDIYHTAGDTPQAYEMYEQSLQYNPLNVLVLNNYSYFLALEGKELSRAERMSAKAVKAEPDNATYLDTYAWIFFKQGNYTLARIYLESALDKMGEADAADLYEHYGDVLVMLGEVDKALEYWQKAIDAGSESVELLKQKMENKKYIEK